MSDQTFKCWSNCGGMMAHRGRTDYLGRVKVYECACGAIQLGAGRNLAIGTTAARRGKMSEPQMVYVGAYGFDGVKAFGGPTNYLAELITSEPEPHPEPAFILMYEQGVAREGVRLYRWHEGRCRWVWIGRGLEPLLEDLPRDPEKAWPTDDDIPF